MINFHFPPEYGLIVNAFNQTNSLRGAAALLKMDPPSLVRKVQKISAEYGYLQKVGNRWTVTEAGRRVAQWADEIVHSQSQLGQERSVLRISSFSWLAEEMLIPHYSSLKKNLDQKQSCLFRITASNQEHELMQSRTDFVIQGHAPTDPTIAYKKISTHYWVVVVPHSWKKQIDGISKSNLLDFLHSKPFVPLASINPEVILGFQPQRKAVLTIDGVVGVRSAVVSGHGWSVLPLMAAQNFIRDKKLHKLDVPTFLKDEVSVWWVRARRDLSETAKIVAKWVSEL